MALRRKRQKANNPGIQRFTRQLLEMPSKKIKPLPEILIVVKYICGNTSQGPTAIHSNGMSPKKKLNTVMMVTTKIRFAE